MRGKQSIRVGHLSSMVLPKDVLGSMFTPKGNPIKYRYATTLLGQFISLKYLSSIILTIPIKLAFKIYNPQTKVLEINTIVEYVKERPLTFTERGGGIFPLKNKVIL